MNRTLSPIAKPTALASLLGLFAFLLLGGCSSPVAEESAKVTTAAKPAVTAELEKASEPKKEFKPPFPKRTNPFARPSTDVAARIAPVAGVEVKLKGFVESDDQPRALVSIDGRASMLAQGEEKNGIRVLEIAPPEVILQRGHQRWTARLFQ